MYSPQTVEAITARIEGAMQRVIEAVSSLSNAQLLEPRLASGRSVKDVLAHLTRQIVVTVLDVVRVVHGAFAQQWGGPDLLDVLQQLGAVVSLDTSRESVE